MIERSTIIQTLRNVKDPELERDIVALNFISGIDIQKHKAVVHFQPDTLACPPSGLVHDRNRTCRITG